MGEGITNQLEKKQFLLNLGASWGRKDPKAAELWMMDDIQRGNYQKNKAAYDGILSEAIQWQHDEVFQKISSIQDESLREAVTLQAAGKLSQFDPKLAAEILSKLPNQQSKEHISTTATLTCNWLEKDPIKATMWVRSMSPGASKDVAISEVVKNVLKVDKDPSLATSWATEIQSITVRTRALERVEEMKRNDP